MSYTNNKAIVINLFDNHIIKYIVKDLEILNSIEADSSGYGGCAIPQASSTFAALDLIGYLIHPQELKTVSMSFTDLLKNNQYFPDFVEYTSDINFFDSFKENIRSVMVHRFSLSKYDIAKADTNHLFYEQDGRQIFNTSFFTKTTIVAINKICNNIKNDSFVINGYDKEYTMEKIKNRIEKLKDFEGKYFSNLINLPISTTTTETTSSLE